MLRSFMTGVSGLRSHQVSIEVIGNNIANINTFGFKSNRATFSETLTQTLRPASRALGARGGINPIQLGLGINVGSIQSNFSQGAFTPTGNPTDLALEGNGFFILSDGRGQFYTRAGVFELDAEGNLVSSINGFKVQGKTLIDPVKGQPFDIPPTGDITVPFSLISPAKATTTVKLQGNLNADSLPLTQELLSNGALLDRNGLPAEETTLLSDLQGAKLTEGDLIRFFGTRPDKTIVSGAYLYRTGHTVGDFLKSVRTAFKGTTATIELDPVTNQSTGKIRITDTRPGESGTRVSLSSIRGGTWAAIAATPLPNSRGAPDLTLTVRKSGTVSAEATLTLNESYTDIDDLIDDIRGKLDKNLDLRSRITVTKVFNPDGTEGVAFQTIEVGEATTIEATGGAVPVLGFAATSDTGSDDNILTLPSFSTTVVGREAGKYTINTTVFDSVGGQHTLSVTFTKDVATPFAWNFEVQVDGGKIVPASGRLGSVSFNNDGSLASFNTDPLVFTPAGAQELKISLNSGAPNSFNGLFQFTGSSTAVATGQDGFGQGNLTQITIDKRGTVVGSYTNGTARELARLVIALFNNPSGLLREANNLFAPSLASGDPIIREPLNGIDTAVAANTLEASNVDLSKELTDMVVAQRGFQANARVIRTSEEILDEAVNLVR